ncbi:LEA14-like dessication related protein [Desulfuromusa kysingii]|uniref:LEA14-like dessication related protein n=1 Tax=Desulfuromusa kysingii TaxID=37625 RepID=A0A1H4APC4_9BACT|nr:LEA type 2 family protein [Desulfuromusa kysingii]SEA37743.1 LEA14-like dessication related protein [Desulfuromusa kysingii]
MNRWKYVLLLLLTFVVAGCASLFPRFEAPSVTVSSFQVVPGDSIVPTFEIGLHVINPNRNALKLQGLSYNVELEGYRVLSGVSNQLPEIEAYGEGDVLLLAKPDLFSTISLFTDLMNRPRDKYHFNLDAILDVGGLMPKIRVNKKGEVALAGGNH